MPVVKQDHRSLGELARQAAEGDRAAFEALYRATAEAQYFQAVALLRDEHLAMDAVQESYLALHHALPDIEKPQAVVAYLNRCTFQCCRRLQRKAGRVVPVGEEALEQLPQRASTEELGRRETALALQQELARLPEEQRLIVIRHYYLGERLADIAAEMGMSLSTVKRQLRQAKARLRRGLGQLAVVPLGLALPRQLQTAAHTLGSRAALPPAPVQGRISGWAVGAGATLTAAVTLLAAQLLAAPGLTAVAPGETPARTAMLEAVIRGRPVDGVLAEGPGGESAWMVGPEGGRYTLPVGENGRYTLTAFAGERAVCSAAVTVGCIDREGPVPRSAALQEGRLSVALEEDPAGLDAEGCYLCRGEARYPLQPEGEQLVLEQTLPSGDYLLVLTDRLGNQSETPLSLASPPAEQ